MGKKMFPARRVKGTTASATYPSRGRILKQSGKRISPVVKYREPIVELMKQKMERKDNGK